MAEITEQHKELMRHALGGGGRRPGYRNRFAADPGSDDDVLWQELCAAGLARHYGVPGGVYPYNWYRVTEEGQEMVGIKEHDDD
jgi:hypothetical protein